MKGKPFLLCAMLCCLAACQTVGTLMSEMDDEEKAFNARQSQTVVAFMSLETMFPDQAVRALAEAAGKGQLRKVDELVASGVDVNARGTSNATPLFWAMQNIDGFRRLLELGADPNVVYDDGGSIMYWSVSHEDDQFLRLALEHGGDPNLVAGQMGETPLFDAVHPGNKSKVSVLLDAGANINAKRINGDTPLMPAALINQFDAVYLLLERGADYTVKNNQGRDLASRIAYARQRMDPNSDLTRWSEKVVAWLAERNVEIPEWKPAQAKNEGVGNK